MGAFDHRRLLFPESEHLKKKGVLTEPLELRATLVEGEQQVF
jgi:hypothetical protein